MTKIKHIPDVATLCLKVEKCIGCGMCATVCPHAVFRMAGKKAEVVERDACMECGACACNCPTGAIDVDAGVGCAHAIIVGALTGREPTCDTGGSCCG